MRSLVNHGNCGGRHWEPVPISEINEKDEVRVTEIRTFLYPLTKEPYTRRYIMTGTVFSKEEGMLSLDTRTTRHIIRIEGTDKRLACFEKKYSCDQMDRIDARRRRLNDHPRTVR